jgi:hypothetical protein
MQSEVLAIEGRASWQRQSVRAQALVEEGLVEAARALVGASEGSQMIAVPTKTRSELRYPHDRR